MDFMQRPEHFGVNHYYGDTVRILLVIAAGLLLISQFLKNPFLSPMATLVVVVVYIAAAGLTNPVQTWIHYINVAIAGGSLIIFGSIAITRFQQTHAFLGNSLIVSVLVIIFLIGLYTAIRTLRGTLMRGAPTIQ